ncbi:MAG: plastocyanin/azurin family copper-binding protein [Actinomycetota bacterium]
MRRLLLITALAAAAISLPASATGEPAVTLTGVVGPSMTITLKNPDGTNVTHLDVGTYQINVDDRADIHNFHLFGPGVQQETVVENVETASWTVTFVDGTYTFRCDPHAAQMKGTFTVGNVPPPPPPPVKLNGKVTARTISLKDASTGTKVRSVVTGKFKVAVTDTAKTQNFHLTGPGVNKKTGIKARVKTTWTLTLAPGKYTYRSDKNRRLKGTFTVRDSPQS